jgi:iron-sulfur cluster repair protein YtfE (RIC family)
MTTLMQPLHDEHQELLPYVEALRTAADAVGTATLPELRRHIAEAHEFLTQHLLAHAAIEEAVLYPAVERVMDCQGATATMRRDHLEVERFTRDLATIHTELSDRDGLPDAALGEIRRVLYGLYALVTVHFAKEEADYLPLLEARLTEHEAATLLARMHDHHTDHHASTRVF